MSYWIYLGALVLSICGLLVIDRRLKLAFWNDARRTALTLGPAMLLFILWDAAGIIRGIFYHGSSRYSLPFTIAPEFPIEELFFLFLLTYTALLLYIGGKRLWKRT